MVTDAITEHTSKQQFERTVTMATQIRSNLQERYTDKVHFNYTPSRESDEQGIYLKAECNVR